MTFTFRSAFVTAFIVPSFVLSGFAFAEDNSDEAACAGNDAVSGDAGSGAQNCSVSDNANAVRAAESNDVRNSGAQAGGSASSGEAGADSVSGSPAPDHVLRVAPFKKGYRINAELVTSLGTVSCELYADTHPLTALNFVALAQGSPAWIDASGAAHATPYYSNLKFGSRKRGAYAVSGTRREGTGFTVADERCAIHKPVAGSIAMVQSVPGTASAVFMLLARDIPEFSGMYAVFGQCRDISVIEKLTAQDATLDYVKISNIAW